MPPLSPQLIPLLTTEIVEKLKKQGIKTVIGYGQCDMVALSKNTGLPHKLLTKIQQCLLLEFASHSTTAASIWHKLRDDTVTLLSTGCTNVDHILGGGIKVGELTELTGVPSSGKTQLCHSIAAAAVLQSNATVLWVDTTGGFTSTRLHSILNTTGATEEVCPGLLERIRICRLFDLFDMFDLLEDLSKQVSNQSDWFYANLHLFVVDSVTPLLSPLLGGTRGHGHALLTHFSSQLRLIAHEHSIAVVYTNGIVSDMRRSGGVKPALGQTWSYVPHTRISLSSSLHTHHPPTLHRETDQRRENGADGMTERVATLTKSSRLVSGMSTSFTIT